MQQVAGPFPREKSVEKIETASQNPRCPMSLILDWVQWTSALTRRTDTRRSEPAGEASAEIESTSF